MTVNGEEVVLTYFNTIQAFACTDQEKQRKVPVKTDDTQAETAVDTPTCSVR
jgi:hypothetical protein